MKPDSKPASLADYLFAWPQYLLPHHAISRLVLWLTRVRVRWFKNALIKWFIGHFKVNMAEACQADYRQYAYFNAFFTRELQPGVRPVAESTEVIISPVDGTVSQLGKINDGVMYQAKGHTYTSLALLGGYTDLAAHFTQGIFTTLYLSPRDYHRIHMPCSGQLQQMVYVPGRLFSVNPKTVRTIPNLFARNERVITLFDTAFGPMAMVLVGAINVGCIETVWHGVVTPPHRQPVHRWMYAQHEEIHLHKADEMGRFNMGSTVICLFANDHVTFDPAIIPDAGVKMGQPLALISREGA